MAVPAYRNQIMITGVLFVVLVGWGHVLLPSRSHAANGSTQTPGSKATPSQSVTDPVSTTPNQATSPTRPIINVQQGRISLHVQQMRLKSILRRMAVKTDISFRYHANTNTTLTTIALDNVTIETAVKHLLADYDAVLFYRGAGAAKPNELKAVWIYPQGQSLTALEGETGDHTVVDAALDPEPEKRAQAYERMIQRPEFLSPGLLLNGLQDRDADVRLRVISQAMRAHVELPVDMLGELALVDSNARVRLAALSAISSHPTIDTSTMASIAYQASQDSDPAVQSQAMELLAHLEAVRAGESADHVEFQNVDHDETVDAGNMAVPSEPVVQ